jgi:replicative DNA helicase
MTAELAAMTPPHDIEAERIALGAMMLSADALADVADVIRHARWYYRPAHRTIHTAIVDLDEAGEPTDAAAVRMELARRGELRGELSSMYLHGLVEAVPVAANGPYFARKVAAHGRTRDAQEGLMRALQITQGADFDSGEGMDRVRQAVEDATAEQNTGSARWMGDSVYETLSRLEEPLPPNRVTPPYTDLRDYVPGLRPGQLTTIAARPSIGKSLVAGDFARHASLRLGLPVAWFSLEMSREELDIRALSAEARVNHEHLQEHTIAEDEWDRLDSAAKSLAGSQVLVDDESGLNLAQVRSRLRAMSRTAPPALVVFDYLQLGNVPGAPSRQEEIASLARGFKRIAKDFAVPVLVAAQLNREAEKRHDKRPALADIRESGEVENSSDIVILLHREDFYDPECARAGRMDLIVAKNRNGRLGTAEVSFQGRFCRCKDLTPEHLSHGPAQPDQHWSPHDVIGDAA